jgi:hypothetical protein
VRPYTQLTTAKPLSEPERRHPDKEEVPGSSPGTPTSSEAMTAPPKSWPFFIE